MGRDYTDYRTPGQLVADLLAERGWTKRVLAIVLGVDEAGITRLVSDKRPVTAEIAISLEDIFEVPAEHFLNLQKSYDLAKARISARPDPGRAVRAQLFGGLPITHMIKRGWLEANDVRDVHLVESALAKFFGVTSTDEIEILPHAAKKTNVEANVTPVQLAWLHRVRHIAKDMVVSRYTQSAARLAISKLGDLLASPEEARKAPRVLAESGIRFTIVETLPSAKVDGATFWLDDTSPVIGMSLRYDRIDNFWFVLRHELEHVLRGHGKATVTLDTELEKERAGIGADVSEEERVANHAAADFCVPRESIQRFIDRKSPLFSQRDVIGFARTLNLHPGLVVGQLQHQTGRYELFRSHLVKIRSIISPSAIVDGWGDIVPVRVED